MPVKVCIQPASILMVKEVQYYIANKKYYDRSRRKGGKILLFEHFCFVMILTTIQF